MSTLRYPIQGSKNIKTIFSLLILFCGGCGFLLAGLSSFFHYNLLSFTNTSNLKFIPQGITLTFYGSLALSLSCYLFFYILWNVGSGYNEFSQEEKILRIIRKGFPGKNRNLFFSYEFSLIKEIRLQIKNGLNPRSNIIVILKDKREIPLFPPQDYLNPMILEKDAIELSDFLKVPLKIN